MICHDKTIWHQVIAIKNRRNIQLSVFCLDFSNVCNAFFQRCICCKITFQKIVWFTSFMVCFGDSVGLSFGFMNQVYPFHHAANGCFAWDFDAVKAIPHEACAAETQIYFSSDCIEFLKAYCRMVRKLCVIWRKICKFMTCKVFWRALCGVALNTVLHWEVVWKFHYNNFWNNLKGVA